MLINLPSTLILLLGVQSAASLSLSLISREDAKASADYTQDNLFKATILNVTNTYRKQHNATALTWNNTLADFAKDWSKKCNFEHSGGPNGENLSSGYPNASQSIIAWGHERVDYDFKKGEFGHETGHFTQLVWKKTRSVGCGRTECDGEGKGEAPGWFVVCEYYPRGNVVGSFVENVQEQVPEEEQPEGPSDPDVPEQEPDAPKKCPQGGDCSAGTRLGLNGVLCVAGVVVWTTVWWL